MKLINNLKIRNVINADGKMSILGVSKIQNSIVDAMKFGGQRFFVMDELVDEVDVEIASMFEAKAAHVVNSASAGIALSAAALIYGDRNHDVNKIEITKREIVLPKGHNIDFGAPIEDILCLVGSNVVEAGSSNRCSKEDVIRKISVNTAALMYVVSHHAVQKGMLNLDEMILISKERNVPLIVDCAAEEDIVKYTKKGISAIIFSGTKAFEGPTTGLVFGNEEVVKNIKLMHKTIGRTMKVGKELLLGCLQAMDNYKNLKPKEVNYDAYMKIFETKNSKYDVVLNKDAVRDFFRIKIILNQNSKLRAAELSEKLRNLESAIYLRDYYSNENWLEIDLRQIDLEDTKIIKQNIDKFV